MPGAHHLPSKHSELPPALLSLGQNTSRGQSNLQGELGNAGQYMDSQAAINVGRPEGEVGRGSQTGGAIYIQRLKEKGEKGVWEAVSKSGNGSKKGKRGWGLSGGKDVPVGRARELWPPWIQRLEARSPAGGHSGRLHKGRRKLSWGHGHRAREEGTGF